jgi:hypothetical protein
MAKPAKKVEIYFRESQNTINAIKRWVEKVVKEKGRLKVERLIAISARGIFTNSPSSIVGQVVEIYSRDIPVSERVFSWTSMMHVSVEVTVVGCPRAWGIFANSLTSSPGG